MNSYIVGGYYSIEIRDKEYRLIKILSVNEYGLHIALYKGRFTVRPKLIIVDELSYGSPLDDQDYGMAHLPFTRELFEACDPVFIETGMVCTNELEGYRTWVKQKGSYWGKSMAVK